MRVEILALALVLALSGCAGTIGYHSDAGKTVGVSVAIGNGEAGAAEGGEISLPGAQVVTQALCFAANYALSAMGRDTFPCGVAPEADDGS